MIFNNTVNKIRYVFFIFSLVLIFANNAESKDYPGDVYPTVLVKDKIFRVIFENNVEERICQSYFDFDGNPIAGKQRIRAGKQFQWRKDKWTWPHTGNDWGILTPSENSGFTISAAQDGSFSLLESSNKRILLHIKNITSKFIREKGFSICDAFLNNQFLTCLFFEDKKLVFYVFDPKAGNQLFREVIGTPIFFDVLSPHSSNIKKYGDDYIVAWIDKNHSLFVTTWRPGSDIKNRVLLHGIQFSGGLSINAIGNNLLIAWHQMDMSVHHAVIRTKLEKMVKPKI